MSEKAPTISFLTLFSYFMNNKNEQKEQQNNFMQQ